MGVGLDHGGELFAEPSRRDGGKRIPKVHDDGGIEGFDDGAIGLDVRANEAFIEHAHHGTGMIGVPNVGARRREARRNR
jgi:hypothetical protein